jgi:hypothetical protein
MLQIFVTGLLLNCFEHLCYKLETIYDSSLSSCYLLCVELYTEHSCNLTRSYSRSLVCKIKQLVAFMLFIHFISREIFTFFQSALFSCICHRIICPCLVRLFIFSPQRGEAMFWVSMNTLPLKSGQLFHDR